MSSANESATSATMSAPRSRSRAGPPAVPRAPSFITSARSAREARSAGSEAEQKPGGERQGQREAQHARIDRGLGEPRHAAGPSARRPATPAQATSTPTRAAQQRQQQALDQQLPHEAPARRAERRADGDLAPPHRRAREQQVRHVRAGDEEHHADGAGQREEERPRIADHEALQRERAGCRGPSPRPPAAGARTTRCALRRCARSSPGRSRPSDVQEVQAARRVARRSSRRGTQRSNSCAAARAVGTVERRPARDDPDHGVRLVPQQ